MSSSSRRIIKASYKPEAQSVVGVLCNDPFLPGRLYVTEGGSLTKEIEKAKRFSKLNQHEGLEVAQGLSKKVFSRELLEAEMEE